jgi:hypothetical protein
MLHSPEFFPAHSFCAPQQDFASKEVLALAEEFVSNGRATWKPDIDENMIREMVKSWQGEKNSKVVKSMFGKKDKSIL